MTEIFLPSLLLGVAAGLSAGLFGIGGGVLIVPVLSWLFILNHFNPELTMLLAVATSLAAALFSSAASARTHHKLGNIDWRRVFRLSPGLLVGAGSGAVLAEYITADMLRWFFIAYLLYTSLHMALPRHASTGEYRERRDYLDYIVGLLIGGLSAVLGIGGGTMTVPYLVRSGLVMKKAVAVSSACALPIALSGALSYALLGWRDADLPAGSLGYVYLPAFAGIVLTSVFTAPLGAKWAHRLPAQHLKRYFAVLLVLIAVKMAWL